MTDCPLTFANQHFVARASGALFWPAQDALIVADLHLGKSERMARRGGALLPPYDVIETLARLEGELSATGARRLIALGDSFDDDLAAPALMPALLRLAARCDVTWIAGNHDPQAQGLPGRTLPERQIAGIAFRHIAQDNPDISGHYHPKLMFAGQRVAVFLAGAQHLILPAFGTYTGGLDCSDPVLTALVPQGCAILTGRAARMVPFPLPPRRRARPARRALPI